jgi:hypothetical protein
MQNTGKVTANMWNNNTGNGVVADVIDTKIIANPNDSRDDESEEATDFSDSNLARPL